MEVMAKLCLNLIMVFVVFTKISSESMDLTFHYKRNLYKLSNIKEGQFDSILRCAYDCKTTANCVGFTFAKVSCVLFKFGGSEAHEVPLNRKPKSCRELQSFFRKTEDGHGDLTPDIGKGKAVKIFCSEMNTDSPKEYISCLLYTSPSPRD